MPENSAHAAYEAIAGIYDAFTAHHDYELWLGNLLPELERLGLRRGHLLDVGCGTGKSFLPMLDRGWVVTGCDLSPAMLAIAQGKVDANTRLIVADMRELPRLGGFDLVWALDDAVNYLLTRAELGQALASMASNLARGGLLAFDLNTLTTFRKSFAGTSVTELDGRQVFWRGEATADAAGGSICQARVEADDGLVATHIHRQRHFPESEVRASLAAAGLECRAVFGHGEDAVFRQPLDEGLHTKAVYMASLA